MLTNNHADASGESSTDMQEFDGPNSCNEHPVVVKFEEVSAAAFKIKGKIERTPCNVSLRYQEVSSYTVSQKWRTFRHLTHNTVVR